MFTLSLHPLKRDRGRMKEGVEFTWRRRSSGVDDDLLRRERSCTGPLEKSLKKLRKRFGRKDKNALSLHPLSLLKKRG